MSGSVRGTVDVTPVRVPGEATREYRFSDEVGLCTARLINKLPVLSAVITNAGWVTAKFRHPVFAVYTRMRWTLPGLSYLGRSDAVVGAFRVGVNWAEALAYQSMDLSFEYEERQIWIGFRRSESAGEDWALPLNLMEALRVELAKMPGVRSADISDDTIVVQVKRFACHVVPWVRTLVLAVLVGLGDPDPRLFELGDLIEP